MCFFLVKAKEIYSYKKNVPVAAYATLPSSLTSIPDRCSTFEILIRSERYWPRAIPGKDAVSSNASRMPN